MADITANTADDPSKASSAPEAGRLPGARTALLLLLSINMFNYIDRYILAAVEPRIEETFFAPDDANAKFWMGMLSTAFMVAYMIAAPIFNVLAYRMSRWLLIGIGVIVWSLASGASGLAGTFMLLLLTRCLVGVGEGAYGPAAPAVISELYPRRVRSTVLGWFYMAIPVGGALGFILGGSVATRMDDWRWPFYVVVPPGILLGIWAFCMREPTHQVADEAVPHPPNRLEGYRIFLTTPSYILNTLGMTAMCFTAGGIAYWMPNYIYKERGVNNLEEVNWIFGAITVVSGLAATLLGGFTGSWLQPRLRGAYFLVSAFPMLLAFPCILLVIWAPLPWAWVFVFLSVFCLYFNTGPTNTILADVTHPTVRASAFAVNIFIIHALGDAISPAVIGKIAGHSSLAVGFAVVSGVTLLGGLFWIWGARYLERDTALAPTRL